MAILADTVIHGNVEIKGAIICQDEKIYSSLADYENRNVIKDPDNPEEDIEENNPTEDNKFCEINSNGDMQVQANQQLFLTGYEGIKIQAPLSDNHVGTPAQGKIILEGNIEFRKNGEETPSEYEFPYLKVGKANNLSSKRTLTFYDGYLTYKTDDLLGNPSIKATSPTSGNGINPYYLPITYSGSAYTIKNFGQSSLVFSNSSTVTLNLNGNLIKGATNKNLTFESTLINLNATSTAAIKASRIDLNGTTYFNGKNLQTILNEKVPNSRKINDKALTEDFNLTMNMIFKKSWIENVYKTKGSPAIQYKETDSKTKKTVIKNYTLSDAQWNKLKEKLNNNLGKRILNYLIGMELGTISHTYTVFASKKNVTDKLNKI